jgi:hypothetical protein
VSVDQLESSHLCIITQIKGIPTRDRYRIDTVFVDHHSDFTFTSLQRNSGATDTLAAKNKRYARSLGVHVERYHSDNGLFAETLWQQDVRNKGHYGSYCGVNAHH